MWIEQLEKHKDNAGRLTFLLEEIGQYDQSDLADVLVRYLFHSRPIVREGAVLGLYHLIRHGHKKFIPILKARILVEESPAVRNVLNELIEQVEDSDLEDYKPGELVITSATII